jgi:hypothetical protein
VDGRPFDVELVGSGDHDRLGHGAEAHALEDGVEQDALLGSAEARGGSRSEDDDR